MPQLCRLLSCLFPQWCVPVLLLETSRSDIRSRIRRLHLRLYFSSGHYTLESSWRPSGSVVLNMLGRTSSFCQANSPNFSPFRAPSPCTPGLDIVSPSCDFMSVYHHISCLSAPLPRPLSFMPTVHADCAVRFPATRNSVYYRRTIYTSG